MTHKNPISTSDENDYEFGVFFFVRFIHWIMVRKIDSENSTSVKIPVKIEQRAKKRGIYMRRMVCMVRIIVCQPTISDSKSF